MSQTWYMSFTFTNPPPAYLRPGPILTDINSTIYLCFTLSGNTITNWYNISNTCQKVDIPILDTITSPGRKGVFLTTSTSFTTEPIINNSPVINGVNGPGYNYFKFYGGGSIIDPTVNYLIFNTTSSSSPTLRYYGTYVFSNTTLPCCFSEGTRILGLTAQLKEEYRLVQDLIIGDFIKSYLHGYRKVSKILKGFFVNNPTEQGVANCMYRMSKTEDNGLIEDLTLTRNHGVLVEKLTEDEEKKVDKNNLPVIDGLLSIITADSDKFEKVKDTNVYNYYHFSLDGDGDNDRRFGVYANGLLVETPSNNMMDGAMNIKPLDF
jgi:hypothetical protein